MGIGQVSVPELDNLRDWLVLCSGRLVSCSGIDCFLFVCFAELVRAQYVSLTLVSWPKCVSFAGPF